MIENMRKYTGLMVVVLVLLAAGLILTMKPGGSGGGGRGTSFMNVNGVALDRNDFSKAGEKTLAALQRMPFSDFQTYQSLQLYIQALSGSARSATEAQLNFVSNRILLKQKAAELGIYANTDVAAGYIEENMFKNREGAFDIKAYQTYIENIAGLGLTESDFQQIVAEYVVFDKTLDVVAGGLTPSEKETLALMKANQQVIDLSAVTLKAADFTAAAQPTDAEVKAYWETHKDSYQTDRQLKVTYALTLLDDSDEPKRPTPAADAEPDAIAQLNLKYEEEKTAWETSRKAQMKILSKIFQTFSDTLDDSDYTKFDSAAAVAKEAAGDDFQHAKTEAFSAKTAPAALKDLIVKHSKKSLIDTLFAVEVQNDVRFNTKPYSVGRDGHIVVMINEEIAPATKTFEQAKELAKADLIAENAAKALEAAAKKAQTELTELVKTGKTFAEAATEKGFTTVEHKAVKTGAQGELAEFYRIAQVTAPKSVATDLGTTDTTTSIVYVESRVYEIPTDSAAADARVLDSASQTLKFAAFNAWVLDLSKDADLNLPRVN